MSFSSSPIAEINRTQERKMRNSSLLEELTWKKAVYEWLINNSKYAPRANLEATAAKLPSASTVKPAGPTTISGQLAMPMMTGQMMQQKRIQAQQSRMI